MEQRKVLSVAVVLIVGMFAGVLLAGLFEWPVDSGAENASPTAALSGRSTGSAAIEPSLDADLTQNLNNLFVTVAQQAKPSVVTIFSDRIVKNQRSPFGGELFDQFFGDDFFDRFFSPHRPDGERRVRGLGSGVIVKEEGYILTNNHVIRNADEIQVMLHDGKKVDAEIVGTDAKTDIAVVKIDADGLEALSFGNSDELKVGEWVIAIGSPLSENLARTVTSGIVSATGRSNVGLADYEDFIQTDAAINPGNSGGALVNLSGELVGVNTAIATQTGGFLGIGFAVPINMASQVMDALITKGKVVRGWLGVYIQDIDQNLAKAMNLSTADGALVSSVTENSPAEKAGIESGDVILAIEGKAIENITELRHEIASRAPETEVGLKILRNETEREITVTLGELPEDDTTPAMRRDSLSKLGLSVQTLDEQLAARLGYKPNDQGVIITRINQTSAAYQAGLRRGDLIREVNRERVTTAGQFSEVTRDLSSGDDVLIFAQRGQNTFFAAFELE